MYKLLIIAAAIAALSGCARVETGDVGILKHWGGTVSTDPQTGFVWTILDTMVANVDATETRAPINDLRPSDNNGVLLDKLDIVVSFRLAADKVPAFYIQTKELDTYKDDTGREVTTVGLRVLENMVKHAVQEQTKQQSLVTLASNLTAYETAILKQAQGELDKGYPGVFQLIRVNVNHFVPPQTILNQANMTAALNAEAERNVAELHLIEQRKHLEEGKAQVEAQALKSAMLATGLSAQDLIAWKNARAYELQAANIGGVARTLDVQRQPK